MAALKKQGEKKGDKFSISIAWAQLGVNAPYDNWGQCGLSLNQSFSAGQSNQQRDPSAVI